MSGRRALERMAIGRLVRRGEQRQDGGDSKVEGGVPVPEVAIHGLGPGANLGLGGEGGAAQRHLLSPHLNALADAGIHQSEIQRDSLSTTVVSKWQEAGSLVFGSGRTGRGIGAVFASQTKAEDAPDYASRATATE